MTGEEMALLCKSLDRLTETLAGNQELVDKVDRVLVSQAAMDATLKSVKGATETQTAALFEYRDQHEQRLAVIEKTYIPRETCERTHDQQRSDRKGFERQNAEEHAEFRSQINAISIRMAKIGGGIAVATALLNWVASNWHWLGKVQHP